jgi:hypothetical protein
VEDWSGGRAVRGAIRRLDETGFIKQVRARKKGSKDLYLVCIKLLRAPNDDDIKNLRFKRKVLLPETPGNLDDNLLESDEEGDALERDLQLDMEAELEVDSDEIDRIPPQWTPERMMANLILEAADVAGVEGSDSASLRQRTVGKFWKRPVESYISRLTDSWEQSQPHHLRHLALVRDTAVSNERKFLHYVYRTYNHYDKAVEQGHADWEVVSMEATKKVSLHKGVGPNDDHSKGPELDPWGFLKMNEKDFERRQGSSTIAECRASINRGARQGPHWDNALAQKMGYEKYKKYADKPRSTTVLTHVEIMTRAEHKLLPQGKSIQQSVVEQSTQEPAQESVSTDPIHPKIRKQQSVMYGGPPLLTTEQRVALGLPPKGRLGAEIEQQIRIHRTQTGDPTALPAVIIKDNRTPRNAPLLTKEERRAQGLSELGRIPKAIENQIRLQRGIAIAPPKPNKQRKKRDIKDPPLLTKEQRIARGLPERGRLKQSIIDEIRREQNIDMSPDPSYDPTDSGVVNQTDDGSDQPEVDLDEIPNTVVSTVPLHEVGSTTNSDAMEAVRTVTPEPTAQIIRQPEDVVDMTLKNTDIQSSIPLVSQDVRSKQPSSSVLTKRKAIESTPDSQPVAKKLRRGLNSPSISRSTGSARQSRASSAMTIEQTAIESLEPINPSTSLVNSQVQKTSTAVAKRPDPGVYINPFATRPLPRGRPKNAFMAIFKSTRLRELEWFKPAPIILKKTPVQRSAEQIIDSQQDRTGLAISTLTSSSSRLNSSSPKNFEMTPSDEINAPVLPKDVVQPITEEQNLVAPEEHTPRISAWNPINASSTTYQSPYALTPVAQSPVQTMIGTEIEAGNASQAIPVNSVSAVETPAVTDDENIISNGSKMPIVNHSQKNGPWIHPRRGVLIGKGSHTRYRTSLAYDIILRCNGVFPGNGEILAPFYTLWDQCAPKHLHKPDRSTLARTLKDMVQDPEFKLKKMSFIMPTITGGTTMEKSIYALTEYSSSNQEVKALQENMIKAHPRKFYPEGIRDLVLEEPVVQVQPVIEIDDSVEVNSLYPPTARKLDHRIEASARNRKTEKAKKKQKDTETRKSQNAEVEKTLSKRAQPRAGVRTKVPRLATLNDKPRTYRRITIRTQSRQDGSNRGSPAQSDSSEDTPLPFLRPLQSELRKPLSINVDSDDDDSSSDGNIDVEETMTTLMDPDVQFTPSNGTFSTEFTLRGNKKSTIWSDPIKATSVSLSDAGHDYKELRQAGTGKKRVRIAEPYSRAPPKRPRLINQLLDLSEHENYLGHNEFSDPSDNENFIAETSDEEEDDDDDVLPKRKPRRRPEEIDQPTLVERLTGLTGDPDDPIPVPPVKRAYQKQPKRWTVHKTEKEARNKKSVEVLDPFSTFRKLCCTLVVASCMSGDDRNVDWNIVANVFSSDKTFDLLKTKSMWAWMQVNMASQLKTLFSIFQSSFLEAYEKGKVASIEDPSTHDWASVVQWSLKKFKLPGSPLPVDRNDLWQFDVVESSYETFSRVDWYKKDLSHNGRTQRMLHRNYASPLHSRSGLEPSTTDNVLRARSWIRANTATPQEIYDGNMAHEKLSPLGIPILERGVTELVDNGVLRMRKLKRLLPGRNYNFMASIALQYRRTFELEDFMNAAAFKKTLDAAFVGEDAGKRAVPVARTANNGAVMALLSLLNEGRVKLVPKLPSVNNTFTAPLPRLSVWGFSEGDYVHRAIDRKRLFWDIDVVPTSTYQFGNPLEPLPLPPVPSKTGEPVAWPQWTEPPLPGKNDPEALLPIWSSIDGQSVTWPWWNRILNIVIQSIMFQPGVTAAEIYRACPSNTVELFEVELIISWLLKVNAVHEPTPNTFEVKPGFWAAFGDRLIGDDDDWFGKHVRRKKTTSVRWRKQYNLQFATMNSDAGQTHIGSEEPEETDGKGQGRGLDEEARRRILLNPNQQYRVVKEVIEAPTGSSASPVHSVQAQSAQEDAIMVDSDVDADGELDAEGESDDEML